MPLVEVAQLAVDRPALGVVVIRVAGNLDRTSAVRILGLVEQQLLIARSRPDMCDVGIVVDLSGVRHFGTGGLDILCEADRRAGRAGKQVHVTGLDARQGVLPQPVADVIPQLRTLPTVEVALKRLAVARPAHATSD